MKSLGGSHFSVACQLRAKRAICIVAALSGTCRQVCQLDASANRLHTYPAWKHGLSPFWLGECKGNTGPSIQLRIVIALESIELRGYDGGWRHEGCRSSAI